jgi:hypothetical protein
MSKRMRQVNFLKPYQETNMLKIYIFITQCYVNFNIKGSIRPLKK